MMTAVLILHILIGILLIMVVMIQGGENVDITAAFGGVSQAAFGPRGAVTTLAKITWVLAAIFMSTAVTLFIGSTRPGGGSVLEQPPAKTAPATPAPTAPANPAPAPAKK